jgi:succinate-semialdehyde dehydrogenase/glutarate-semialdehyde dehydrogenase
VRISGEFGIAPSGANRIVVDYQPIGICVLIMPWNFPAIATRKIAPALAAGCTVILKPASETPLTAYALAAFYEEAGVPPSVVKVLTTSIRNMASALTSIPATSAVACASPRRWRQA